MLLPPSVAYHGRRAAGTGPTAGPEATSHSRLTIHRFARSVLAGEPMAIPGRHLRPRHARTGCTANCRRICRLWFAVSGTPVHGSSRKARAHRRDLQQRQAVMPLAMRRALGPAPLDPNSLAQGIPPDDRVTADKRIFGPVEGTPLPLGAIPRGTPAGPRGATPPPGTLGAAAPPAPSSAATCRLGRGIFRR